MLKGVIYIIFTSIVVLLLLEGFLRLSGQYRTLSERYSGQFYSELDRTFEDDHLLRHLPEERLVYLSDEFHVACSVNSDGFRSTSWEKTEIEQFPSIFIVGDSFIEGFGADSGQTMPEHFDRLTANLGLKAYNAGIAGSDVFYAYKSIEKVVGPISPDIVFLGVNSTDTHEFCKRGGFERFGADGITSFRKSPIPLKYYKRSHLYRYVIHKWKKLDEYTFLKSSEHELWDHNAENAIVNAIVRADSISKANNASFYVFFYPLPSFLEEQQVYEGLDRMHETCVEAGINSVSLVEDYEMILQDTTIDFQDLYWPIDGHFTNEGYRLFAEVLLSRMNEQFPTWHAGYSIDTSVAALNAN